VGHDDQAMRAAAGADESWYFAASVVLACPRRGGRLRLRALLEAGMVTTRILRHLGLPTEVPAARPAGGLSPVPSAHPVTLVSETR
jgi:hypothetical protein